MQKERGQQFLQVPALQQNGIGQRVLKFEAVSARRSTCEYWPPECMKCRTPSGCKHGAWCFYSHTGVAGDDTKKNSGVIGPEIPYTQAETLVLRDGERSTGAVRSIWYKMEPNAPMLDDIDDGWTQRKPALQLDNCTTMCSDFLERTRT